MASNEHHTHEQRGDSTEGDRTRRVFLWAFPAAVCATVTGVLSAAAFRFLRPRSESAGADGEARRWSAVAPVPSLAGAEPVTRKVSITRAAGWASATEERTVFVLPAPGGLPRVVSAVCPHEGCEVDWDAGQKSFLCPCHDSRFGADGAALTGPATRGLDEFPARVENGVLEIQYRPPAPGIDSPRET
jgi:Rieske Fe-S protein